MKEILSEPLVTSVIYSVIYTCLVTKPFWLKFFLEMFLLLPPLVVVTTASLAVVTLLVIPCWVTLVFFSVIFICSVSSVGGVDETDITEDAASDFAAVSSVFSTKVAAVSLIVSLSGTLTATDFWNAADTPSAAFSKLGTVLDKLLPAATAVFASETRVSKLNPDADNSVPKFEVILESKLQIELDQIY